jgi:hypothetical protein
MLALPIPVHQRLMSPPSHSRVKKQKKKMQSDDDLDKDFVRYS